jgi:hypothetical protein
VLAGAQGAPRRVLPLAALDLQAELLNLREINWQAEPRIQHLAQLQGEETTGREGRERGHRARSEHVHLATCTCSSAVCMHASYTTLHHHLGPAALMLTPKQTPTFLMPALLRSTDSIWRFHASPRSMSSCRQERWVVEWIVSGLSVSGRRRCV